MCQDLATIFMTWGDMFTSTTLPVKSLQLGGILWLNEGLLNIAALQIETLTQGYTTSIPITAEIICTFLLTKPFRY